MLSGALLGDDCLDQHTKPLTVPATFRLNKVEQKICACHFRLLARPVRQFILVRSPAVVDITHAFTYAENLLIVTKQAEVALVIRLLASRRHVWLGVPETSTTADAAIDRPTRQARLGMPRLPGVHRLAR